MAVKMLEHTLTSMPQMSLHGKRLKVHKKMSECRVYVSFCVYVCVAVWDTCCFNRRCADVTAEAKKPPLKRKDLEKEREKASSVCIKQWKNWPVKEQMSGRRLKDICFSGYIPSAFPSLILFILFGLDRSVWPFFYFISHIWSHFTLIPHCGKHMVFAFECD